MAIPSVVAKVTLSTLGVGVVGAGIAIPIAQNFQHKNTDSSVSVSPEPTSTEDSSKPLDRETFKQLTEGQHLDCYSFASTESDSSPLLLFCSKGGNAQVSDEDSSGERNAVFKFWGGEELKTAVSLIKENNSKILVTFDSGGSVGEEINIDDYDLVEDDWSLISLSSCKIESQTLNNNDTNKSLTCTYYQNKDEEESDDEVTNAVFLIKKFNFQEKKEKIS